MKHELGKTAPSLTLYPMFLQLLLFGGGPLRELTHVLKPKHTHGVVPEPHPWCAGCFSSSASSLSPHYCYQGEAH